MNPSEWRRQTTTCGLSEIPSDFLTAIRKHVEQHELDNPLSRLIYGCKTQNEPLRVGFFQKLFGPRDRTQHTVALVTAEFLIWGVRTPKDGVVISSARWDRIDVTEYKPTLIDDHGLTVIGHTTGTAGERRNLFIGLGRDSAGEKLKQTIRAASASFLKRS